MISKASLYKILYYSMIRTVKKAVKYGFSGDLRARTEKAYYASAHFQPLSEAPASK
jgi:hypothetical protein